ncbi:unnamed protein product, partial [Symbiodinium pilosum]
TATGCLTPPDATSWTMALQRATSHTDWMRRSTKPTASDSLVRAAAATWLPRT